MKSEKFKARILSKILIGYDGHIIYKIFIQLQDKIIYIKDFQIFENINKKNLTSLLNFKGKLMFKSFLTIDQKRNLFDSDVNISILL